MLLFALTIFASAFLLFLVQPIIAKQILPWFGGSAAVWTTCLVFFQAALLAGYAYSDAVVRRLAPRRQTLLHVLLLVASLAVLPIVPAAFWKPAGNENPAALILGLLAVTIGLPYFLLSTTSPLLQAWFAHRFPARNAYRLFALSNLASLAALLAYPFAIEPFVPTHAQAVAWSAGYAAFVVLCAATAWRHLGATAAPLAARAEAGPADAWSAVHGLPATASPVRIALDDPPATDGSRAPAPPIQLGRDGSRASHGLRAAGSPTRSALDHAPAPGPGRYLLWVGLAATGSVLLLSVTNHITQNIAAVPLLWIVPLTLYLLTFILCFEGRRWYAREGWLPIVAAILGVMAWTLADPRFTHEIELQLGVFCVGLFVACMFCHGELARLKPEARHLTRFYLMVSAGGAAGAALVGILAPIVLPAHFELALGLIVAAGLLAWQVRHDARVFAVLALASLAMTVGCAVWAVQEFYDSTILTARNFYGVLRVQEFGDGVTLHRSLVHGTIMHGVQYLSPSFHDLPTSYYTTSSGIGRLMETLHPRKDPLRVGVIGLGTGTLASYGTPGDLYRFYDINPAVVRLARSEFTYLADSEARIETPLGDARLTLEREPPADLDVLAVDAFSSDAIPVHLITSEALGLYLRHVKPAGVVAFHVTNRYLDLVPVVGALASAHDVQAVWIHDEGDNAL
ncbi:MAG: spermidine synthase, partial [Betaproteobacteria bacterium]